jgi:hypothetical protein
VFQYDVEKHSACFRAVVVITQICLKLGEPLFEVFYDDDKDSLRAIVYICYRVK